MRRSYGMGEMEQCKNRLQKIKIKMHGFFWKEGVKYR